MENKNKNIYKERNELQEIRDKQLKNLRLARKRRLVMIIVGILLVLSIMNIYSATFYNMGMKIGYLKQHIFNIFLGFVVFGLVSKINYKFYAQKKISTILLGLACLVLGSMPILARLTPKIVPRINGAITWIRIPHFLSIQPAEMFKIVFIIIMAYRFAKFERTGEKDWKLIFRSVIVPITFTFLLLFQNDLGTLIHYLCVFAIMLCMAKVDKKIIFGAFASFFVVVAGAFSYIYQMKIDPNSSGYKLLRIQSFLNGIINNYYDSDKGYQVKQSLIGIGSGGLFGVGYGNGIQKYSYLPEINTDFIFASFAEEFGLIGILFLLILFLSLFNQIKSCVVECDNFFGKYLLIGISGYIFTQFSINLSVAIGLLPVFGIPMPFMSYGGSSILTVFAALGIVFNIIKNQEK